MTLWQKIKELQKHTFQLFLTIALLGIASFVAFLLIVSKPSPTKTKKEPVPTPVEISIATHSDEQVIITAFGTVMEKRKLQVQAEVGGRIIEVSPNMVIGGHVKEGEVLIRIDPRDYQTIIEQEKASVSRADLEWKIEKGKQIVAEREWELLDPSIKESNNKVLNSVLGKELALRQPQVNEKKAALEAAKSQLEKSKLDLERTVVRAPFNAIVISENIEIGQVITPQNTVGTLIATDTFWVQASIPTEKLLWIDQSAGTPINTTIYQDLGTKKTIEWPGHVVHFLGDVNTTGRMARIIIAVDDPLDLHNGDKKNYPLLLGSYVKVAIDGPLLKQVFHVKREAVRDNDTLWIMTPEGTLSIRQVQIAYRYSDCGIVDEGLEIGEKIVTSLIPIPIPGMPLRVIEKE